MATAKFKEASPYLKKPSPPSEDYAYNKYLKDIALKTENDSQNDPVIKLALFGAGRAGTVHLTSIVSNPRVKLLYIVDDIEDNWNNMRNYWNLENVIFLNSKQSNKVFKDPNVDAVIVSSPTYTHEDIVVKSLQAKKAVFCEKPIAGNREDTKKCYEMAKKIGKPLLCAFNRRFDPSYAAVRDKVRRGEIGHAHTIKTVSRDSPLPSINYLEMSGGIFHDCMVHDIDIITWTLGECPDKVAVMADANIPEIKAINDYDTVAVTMHFPSGTVGMIDLSRYCIFGYDQRLEVFGPKGMVQADNQQPTRTVHWRGSDGPNTVPIFFSFASRFAEGYRREFQHFIDVVHGKVEPLVESKQILAICKIATACEEAARTGKTVEIKWAKDELPY